MNRYLSLLLGLSLSLPALGRELRQKRRVNDEKGSVVRKIASAESPNRFVQMEVSEGTAPRPKSDLALDLSFLSGLSQVAGATSRSGIHLGLQADLHWGRYLGAELDGYFAPGMEQVTTTSVEKASLYGGLANLKGRYAFRAGENAILTPKVGMGFGVQGINEVSGSGTSSLEGQTKAAGIFFVAGLEARIYHRFTLDIDYASMLFGGGSVGSPLGSKAADAAGFSRFRIGAAYRISVPFSVGAQFIGRTISVESSGTTPSTVGMNQFLGVVTLHW